MVLVVLETIILITIHRMGILQERFKNEYYT